MKRGVQLLEELGVDGAGTELPYVPGDDGTARYTWDRMGAVGS